MMLRLNAAELRGSWPALGRSFRKALYGAAAPLHTETRRFAYRVLRSGALVDAVAPNIRTSTAA
jgi:hypothetical protein